MLHRHHGRLVKRAANNRFTQLRRRGRGQVEKRPLTDLYNQRPIWLNLAHQKLDRSVLAAYGWSRDRFDVAILQRLLALRPARSGR